MNMYEIFLKLYIIYIRDIYQRLKNVYWNCVPDLWCMKIKTCFTTFSFNFHTWNVKKAHAT